MLLIQSHMLNNALPTENIKPLFEKLLATQNINVVNAISEFTSLNNAQNMNEEQIANWIMNKSKPNEKSVELLSPTQTLLNKMKELKKHIM